MVAVTGNVQSQYLDQMRAELADLDKRLGGARSAVEVAQRDVEVPAKQHSELLALINHLGEASS